VDVDPFVIMVTHAKSRFGGRANTDHRRENAAIKLVHRLEQEFDEVPVVLVGDWNDNPDDRSLNILETGSPGAQGGPEEDAGPFLFNLTETLCASGHVSHGRNENDVFSGVINTIDPESRFRNNVNRGNNVNTGDILFDQILVTDELFLRYVSNSAQVFNKAVAVTGSASQRASDHLPVSAVFEFGAPSGDGDDDGPPPAPTVVRIAALLPDPDGQDPGQEEVHLIKPFTAAKCRPFKAGTRTMIEWEDGSDLSTVAGRAVTLRFHLTKGSLYAFWVSPDKTGASGGYVAAGGPSFSGARDNAPPGASSK
jgi:hypothetical protein